MQAIFNELSIPQIKNCENPDLLVSFFIQTCKSVKQANDLSGGDQFVLRIKEDFFENAIVNNWINKKGQSDDEVIFLLSITRVPYLPADDINIAEDRFFEENVSYGGYNIGADSGLRVAYAFKPDGTLVISMMSLPIWDKDEFFLTNSKGNQSLKNASSPKHVFGNLEYFPIWNNYNFDLWKPNFYRDEQLLPLAKLSDLCWLRYIKQTVIWRTIAQRKYYWGKFVENLRHIAVGQKESLIIRMFNNITKVNNFKKRTDICKKQSRIIVCFQSRNPFYLTPDKRHGAFEVYNDRKIHQGEWTFYGKKTTKRGNPDRNICN
ncbi:MAG: hypothetical protein HYY40_04800 [Bacteroidetes bacterium]|nr:hypothetical protein [Bacteroidota bacterium]